jgi:hypothetical protein
VSNKLGGLLSTHGDIRKCTHKNYIWRNREKSEFGRPKLWRKYNIKMDFKAVLSEVLDWIYPENINQGKVFLNTAMRKCVQWLRRMPWPAQQLLPSQQRLFHGISYYWASLNMTNCAVKWRVSWISRDEQRLQWVLKPWGNPARVRDTCNSCAILTKTIHLYEGVCWSVLGVSRSIWHNCSGQ